MGQTDIMLQRALQFYFPRPSVKNLGVMWWVLHRANKTSLLCWQCSPHKYHIFACLFMFGNCKLLFHNFYWTDRKIEIIMQNSFLSCLANICMMIRLSFVGETKRHNVKHNKRSVFFHNSQKFVSKGTSVWNRCVLLGWGDYPHRRKTTPYSHHLK